MGRHLGGVRASAPSACMGPSRLRSAPLTGCARAHKRTETELGPRGRASGAAQIVEDRGRRRYGTAPVARSQRLPGRPSRDRRRAACERSGRTLPLPVTGDATCVRPCWRGGHSCKHTSATAAPQILRPGAPRVLLCGRGEWVSVSVCARMASSMQISMLYRRVAQGVLRHPNETDRARSCPCMAVLPLPNMRLHCCIVYSTHTAGSVEQGQFSFAGNVLYVVGWG